MNAQLSTQDLQERLAKIKLLALDFDGIFTDGSVYVDENEKETVRCDRRDGLGFEMLRHAQIPACIISREPNPVVSARAKKLQLHYWQSVEKGNGKLDILTTHCQELGITVLEVAYMGDDINDLAILNAVGLAITVPAAHPLVLQAAHYITTKEGGRGAIREVIEALLIAQGSDLIKLVL